MKDDIIRKLHEQLSQGVKTEPQVVYVLCEVRKLIEKYGANPDWMTLKPYCHWALHIDLSGTNTVGPFLRKVDQFMYDSFDSQGRGVSSESHEAMRELVYLEAFRYQLRCFLDGYGLPIDLCSDDKRWHTFLEVYSRVIQDGSLIWNGPTDDLKMIRQMTFTREDLSPGTHGRIPFIVKWDILLRTGKVFGLRLHPNGQLVGSVADVR